MEQRQQDLHHNPESRVFIIHAGEDKESFVRPLVTNIQQQGVAEKDIFFDDISIEPGEAIRERIISTLSSERLELAVIVVSTSLLNKQYWPKLEFETCLRNNKRIFPIWVDANNDKFKAFSELVGTYSPTLKQLSARRVQRDNLTDELPIIAAEIVQRLKPKAIQALLHLVPSPSRSDSGSSNEDQGTCMTGVNDEQQVQDKLKNMKEKQLEHLKMLKEIDLDFLTKVSQEGLMPKERIAEMTESMIRDIHQSGLEIIKVKTGCAIIHLVPNSLATLCAFWRDYRSGQLSEDFSQYLITDEMRTVVGKDLSIQVIMLEEQYRQWKHYFDALGSAATLQRITPALQALGAAADVTETFEEFQSLSIDPSSSTTPKTFWRMESEQTQEYDATDAYSGVLQVVDEDAPPLELGPLKISEDDMTPQQMEMLHQKAAETGGNITVKDVQEIAAASKSESAKVQIGLVGDAGAGKSMFINSFRGLSPGESDVGAAKVSTYGHATTQATSYDVPGNELVLVDFPGVLFKPHKEASSHTIQEVPFNIKSYLDLYGEKMRECDLFLIFVTNRPSNNVVWIAKEVQKMGKQALFVRSQADLDIAKVKQDNPKDFPKKIDHRMVERQIMDKFRQRTKEALEELGYGKVDDSNIFIISGLKYHVVCGHYDMDGLRTAMLNCLSTGKQEVLIKNTQDFSVDRLAQKADVMRKRVWAIAAANAAVGAVPVPGLGVAADIATLFAAYKYIRRTFNIDDASLVQLASICNKSVLTLKRFRNQNSTLGNTLKNSSGPVALRNLAAATASSVTIAGLAITSATLNIALPIIGGIIAAPASFALIVLLVRKFIEEMEMCATKLFKFAFSKDLGPADIGIVGDGNAGEASFIRYFFSLVQEEEGDRESKETTFHKTLDHVVLVELPPPHVKKKLFRRTFDEEAYIKSFADDMKTCSMLLVFIGKPISEGLLTIARKAKEMELDVLFIRTCLDEDELMYIDSIRKEVHEDLKPHIDGIAVTDIFVIDVQYDSIVKDKWDIGFLRTAILHAIDKIDMTDRNLMLLEKQEDMPIIALKEGKSGRPSDDILRALNGCTGTIKPTLPDWKTAVISIQLGVIGDSEEDADIRTFSQSLLGLDNLRKPVQASDPAQAAVYYNPNHRCNISVVHFPPASLSPGQRGTLYVSRYMDIHGDKMKDCDLFLVFCQDKVTEEAAWVASKAMEMSKKVLLVGSKHDHTAALGAAAALSTEDTENRELCHKLTKQLQQHLHNAGSTEVMGANSTFIISDEADDMLMGKLDMVRLKTAILSRLNDLQRQAFVICCPDLSPDFVSKKAGVLKKLAWVQAVDAMDVNQGPGLLVETPVKIEIVREACELSQKCFGLDEASLTKIAAVSGTDVQELKIFAQRNLPMCTKLLSEDTDPAPPDNIRTLASLLSENSSTLLTLGLANWAFSTTVPITGFGGKVLNVVAYFLCKMIDEQAECAKELHNFAFHK